LDRDSPALKEVEVAMMDRAPEIPPHVRIQQLHEVDELPKTTTLKVKRSELKKIGGSKHNVENKSGDDVPLDDEARRVLEVVAEVMRQTGETRRVGLESTLQFELGIDSMGLIELASRLEQVFGIHLDESQLPTLYTVADLLRAVKTSSNQDGKSVSLMEGERVAPILPPRGLWALLSLRLFGWTVRCLWKFEVEGTIPAEGTTILCPNHESPIDLFLVASCLPSKLRRTLCCFAKQELFEHFGTRFITVLARAIPTDRAGDILPTLRAGAKVLADGRPLLIHPEGTRTRTGELGPFRGGAARLALSTGVPLVPIRIVGAYDIFPAHRALPRLFNWRSGRRYRLKIIFGSPIAPAAADQTENQLTDHLRQAVVNLAPHERK